LKSYPIVGQALLDMLASVLGKEFDAPTRIAWSNLYGAISETMLRGAARAAC
jgi:hemoglobin-like flavoprotein